MSTSLFRFSRSYIAIITIAIVAIIATTQIAQMVNTSNIDDLEKKLNNYDDKIWYGSLVSAFALAITLGAAIYTIFYGYHASLTRKELEVQRKNQIAALSESAAQANKRAEEAIAKQKESELALEKLRIATGDRFIPAFIAEELKSELIKYKGKKVFIRCIGTEDEIYRFAEQVDSLFIICKWESHVDRHTVQAMPAPTGILLEAETEENRSISKFIGSKFLSLGYKCRGKEGIPYDIPKVDLWITIAKKQ